MGNSSIYEVDINDLKEAVRTSMSLAEVMRRMGMGISGGSYLILKRRLGEEKIDVDHFDNNQKHRSKQETKPLTELMVVDSSYCRGSLKRRLLREGIKQNKCELCGFEGDWQGKPIVMILDHINGINNDNRLENLRMVCPMCNSQLDTFCGKASKTIEKNKCEECGAEIAKRARLCLKCHNKTQAKSVNTRKVERPPYEVLRKEIEEMGYVGCGRKYNVSDNAIRKWKRWYEKQ
jgi:hypothetical protein